MQWLPFHTQEVGATINMPGDPVQVELFMYFFFCIYGLCGAAPLIYRKVRSAVAEIFDMLVPVLLYIVPQV